jgi:hypothetical protein
MQARYKNRWHKPGANGLYGPEHYETNAQPAEYKGHSIYQRLPAVFDIVINGICIAQRAGPTGARQYIDELIAAREKWGIASHLFPVAHDFNAVAWGALN